MVEAQIAGMLLPFVELPWDDPDLVGSTVADILADPARFVGATLADPLEGVAYGRTKAIVMQRPDGSLLIHSFAHGRTVYHLRHDALSPRRRSVPHHRTRWSKPSCACCRSRRWIPTRRRGCATWCTTCHGVKVRPLDKRIRETKQRQARERAVAERSRRAAERTDLPATASRAGDRR